MEITTIILLVCAGATGAIIGSFLNVVIIRGFRDQTLTGRSRCESCRKILSPLELIPIASFIIQKGRCRGCGSRLFWQYPLVEASAALLFTLVIWILLQNLSTGPWFFFWTLISFIGIGASLVIIVSDAKYYLVPDGAVLLLVTVGTAMSISRSLSSSWNSSFYDLGYALFFAIIPASLWLVSRGKWMGLGDAKLFFAVSLIVGFPGALASFLFSFWTAAIFAGAMLASRKKSLKERLPFAPFILLGTALSLFWGEKFLNLLGITELLRLML